MQNMLIFQILAAFKYHNEGWMEEMINLLKNVNPFLLIDNIIVSAIINDHSSELSLIFQRL